MNWCILLIELTSVTCFGQTKSYEQAMNECDKKMQEMNSLANKASTNLYPYCLQGANIPAFTAYTTDHKLIDTSYFKGKITVLNFWLTTCPPCAAEIPGLNKIKDKFSGKKINFLAVGKGPEKDKISFLKLHPWNFDQLQNGDEVIQNIFKFKWGYPTTIIIDNRMKIIQVLHGGFHDSRAAEDIQNKIIPLLDHELNK